MDYGIVAPGPDVTEDQDTHQLEVTHLFNLRSLFSLLSVIRPNVSIVSDLIKFINNDASVTRPIGNIYIGSHSTAEGYVAIQMTPSQSLNSNNEFAADFETIENTLFSLDGSLAIDESAIGPDPTQHFVHFKGCSLGRIPQFMQEWKMAFGGKAQLTAPRFNHGLRVDQFQGVWEYMAYEFIVTSPTPIANRDALIQAYQARNFTFVESGAIGPDGKLVADGPPVPPERWGDWLPALDTTTKKVGGQQVQSLVDRRYRQWERFGVQSLGLPFSTLDVNEEFEAKKAEFKAQLTPNPMPSTQGDRLAALRAFFLADAQRKRNVSRYTPAHPFPIYQRYGYPDFDSFMNGWTWRFSNKAGSPTLYARGTRREYSLFIGLTSPNPGARPADSPLQVNFHPLNPSQFLPINQLPVTDARFFKTV